MDADDRPPTLNPDDTPLTPDEIGPLLDNLADADGELRAASLSALVTLPLSPDAWLAVSERLEPLLHRAARPDPGLLEAAVHVPVLSVRDQLRTLTSSIWEPGELEILVEAMARARDRAALPPLLDAFRGESDHAREWAAEYLSYFDVPDARDEFVHIAANDAWASTRLWSAICLAQLGEPEALERELSRPTLAYVRFLWDHPVTRFNRFQGRGPWPAATQAKLQFLTIITRTPEQVNIANALMSGYGETSVIDEQASLDDREQDPTQAAELRSRAFAIRDRLERTFPYGLDRSEQWETLSYLPERDGASFISHLWERLAEPVGSTLGGNALVGIVRAMGSSFVPEIEPLFETFIRAREIGQFADQIGWTAGRGGMHRVIAPLNSRLKSNDATVQLTATQLIEAAGARAGEVRPPIYGGAFASPPARPIRYITDDPAFSTGDLARVADYHLFNTKATDDVTGGGGLSSNAETGADEPVAANGGSGGSAPEKAAGADELDATPLKPDPGSFSFGLPRRAAAAAGPDQRADASESEPDASDSDGADGAPTDPPRTAYPRLDCPQVVAAGEEFELEVGVAKLRDPSVAGSEIVRPEWSQGPYVLTVWVLADGFSLRTGEALRQHLAVTVAEPYPFATLHLTPDRDVDEVAHRKIEVTYFIGSQPIGIAYREVEVVRLAKLVARTPPPPQPLATTFQIPADFTEPDLTVKVSEGDKPGHLHWTFETPERLNVVTPAEHVISTIGENPARFAKQLIEQMDQKADKSLSLRMRGIGVDVSEATPTAFWEILGNVAASVDNRPPTLLIISQDPYVPWELALVEPPIDPGSAPFLGAQTVLGRWILPRIGRNKPDPPIQDPRMVGSMAILCGDYPEQRGRWKRLPHAEQEAADLKEHYDGVEVIADISSVVDFLENPPDAEVFHFAGHAVYDPTSLENGLVLSDGKYLDATLISGAQFSPKPRPFVFLNACQAGSGYEVLGGYGGLVGALVTAGASAVVAPLWSVNDAEARKVSIEFYEGSVDDEAPPAEMLRRQRARFGKDANGADVAPDTAVHLAYQFFGHPSMRLIRTHS